MSKTTYRIEIYRATISKRTGKEIRDYEITAADSTVYSDYGDAVDEARGTTRNLHEIGETAFTGYVIDESTGCRTQVA